MVKLHKLKVFEDLHATAVHTRFLAKQMLFADILNSIVFFAWQSMCVFFVFLTYTKNDSHSEREPLQKCFWLHRNQLTPLPRDAIPLDAGLQVGWWAGWLVGWLAGWVCRLAGWLVGLAGGLAY